MYLPWKTWAELSVYNFANVVEDHGIWQKLSAIHSRPCLGDGALDTTSRPKDSFQDASPAGPVMVSDLISYSGICHPLVPYKVVVSSSSLESGGFPNNLVQPLEWRTQWKRARQKE